MSLNDIIREALLEDDESNDSTAEEYFNAIELIEPGKYADSTKVPVHLYTSLQTLLGATSESAFGKRIVIIGEGKSVPDASIEIQSSSRDSGYSKLIPSDLLGAATAKAQILFRQPTPVNSPNLKLVENIELRACYVLDHLIRGRSGRLPSLDTSSDNSISDDYFFCSWDGFVDTGSAIEIGAQFQVEYVRQF